MLRTLAEMIQGAGNSAFHDRQLKYVASVFVATLISLGLISQSFAIDGGRGMRRMEPTVATPTFDLGQPPTMRPGDQVWFLSTHRMPTYDTLPSAFQIELFEDTSRRNTSVTELIHQLNEDPSRLNVIFVHGNRTDIFWAYQRGWLIYQEVVAKCEEERPVRLIVWAWPSQQQYGPLRDFRAKAELADSQARHFGWLLRRIDPSRPLGMVGYSFGARVILGGLQQVATQGYVPDLTAADRATNRMLHDSLSRVEQNAVIDPGILAGNEPATDPTSGPFLFASIETGIREVADRASAEISRSIGVLTPVPGYHVAFVAAAFDREWISTHGCMAGAYDQMARLLLINNCQDRALKYYGFIERGRHPSALGESGPASSARLSDSGAKIEQFDVSREVGSEHRIDLYFTAPTVIDSIHRTVFSMP